MLAEQILHAPNFLGYWTPDDIAPPVRQPAAERGYITFGSFNNLAKVTPKVYELWAKLINSIPNARLVIKAKTLNDEMAKNPAAWNTTTGAVQFTLGGVTAEVRLNSGVPATAYPKM